MTTPLGGCLADSLLPQADCESGPSCPDRRAAVADLGFASLPGIVLVAVCARAAMTSLLGVSGHRQQLRSAAGGQNEGPSSFRETGPDPRAEPPPAPHQNRDRCSGLKEPRGMKPTSPGFGPPNELWSITPWRRVLTGCPDRNIGYCKRAEEGNPIGLPPVSLAPVD